MQLFKFLACCGDNFSGIGAAQTNDQALHRFRLAIGSHQAIALQRAHGNIGDLGEGNGFTLSTSDENTADVIQAGNGTGNPHQNSLLPLIDSPCAIIFIVILQGLNNVFITNLQLSHGLSPGCHGIGFNKATEGVDVSDAGDCSQCRANSPVQQKTFLLQRHMRVFHGKHKHVTEWCAHRCQAATDRVGQ